MKNSYLMLLVSFFSISSFACPTLAGKFSCSYNDGDVKIVNISQADVNGMTHYQFNSTLIIPDGQQYPLTSGLNMSPKIKNGSINFSQCDGESVLKAQLTGDFELTSTDIGKLKVAMQMSMNGDVLELSDSGFISFPDGRRAVVSDNVPCQRIP